MSLPKESRFTKTQPVLIASLGEGFCIHNTPGIIAEIMQRSLKRRTGGLTTRDRKINSDGGVILE